MDTNEIKIRPATEADAAEILNIYAPYITDTAITFEYDVPTLEDGTDSSHTGEISVSGGSKRQRDYRLCICRSFLWAGCI